MERKNIEYIFLYVFYIFLKELNIFLGISPIYRAKFMK